MFLHDLNREKEYHKLDPDSNSENESHILYLDSNSEEEFYKLDPYSNFEKESVILFPDLISEEESHKLDPYSNREKESYILFPDSNSEKESHKLDEESLIQKLLEEKNYLISLKHKHLKEKIIEKIEKMNLQKIGIEKLGENSNNDIIKKIYKLYEEKINHVNDIINILNDLSNQIYNPLEKLRKNKIGKEYGGSFLESIGLNRSLYYFYLNLLNFTDYFIFYKDLILYIKKKFSDGLDIFHKDSFKEINNEKIIIRLLYPLIKITDINSNFDLNYRYIREINVKYYKNILNDARKVISFGFIKEKDIKAITFNIKIFNEINLSVFNKLYDKINFFIIKLLEDLKNMINKEMI